MIWKNILGGFVVCAALVVSGYLYLDIRLAELVTDKVGTGFLFSEPVSNMPDLLFLLVSTVTAVSWPGRFCLALMSIRGRFPDFLELIGWTVPLAFILKSPLKELFGKTNTRTWLLHPEQFGFHWFQGGETFRLSRRVIWRSLRPFCWESAVTSRGSARHASDCSFFSR